MSVKFRVNLEIVALFPAPEDDEDTTCNNLRVDDAYAIELIQQLAETGQIKVTQPIVKITRFLTKTEEQLIYDTTCGTTENSENCDPDGQCSDKNLWSEAQTKFVLDHYYLYMNNIGPMKQFKNKKSMWNQIALDLSLTLDITKTAIQIENRYKTLMRKKKAAVENNSKSGRSRQVVPYEAELGKIAGLDDSIEPEVIRSSKSVKKLKRSMNESDSDDDHQATKLKKRKISSVGEILKELQREREDAKAARHREKLELIRELFRKNKND